MIAADTLDRLRTLLGERLQTSTAAREHHARDESGHPASLPDAVVYAESTDDVAAILRLAAQCRLPVVPFGTGTGIEGASITGILVAVVVAVTFVSTITVFDLVAVVVPLFVLAMLSLILALLLLLLDSRIAPRQIRRLF